MKKSILVLALLAILATGAFAQGFSMAAGGGLLFDWSLVGNGYKGTIDVPGMPGSYEANVRNLSIGGFGFFDATYAELDVSFAYGRLTAKSVGSYYGSSFGVNVGANALQLGFTLLGKYPIGLGGFTLFPLLGADYNIMLIQWDKDNPSYDRAGESNQFGLLAGAGLDFPFGSALFLRAEAMFHLRFPSKIWRDVAATTSVGGYHAFKATYGMGPRIQIGLGYKFGGGSASSSSSRSGKYMVVNADTLNVRKGPSADTALVGSLPRGTRVEVLSNSGTWWKIKSGKIEGYVNSSYLKTP